MPLNVQRPGETREMRLISRLVGLTGVGEDNSLPVFIARRRVPGEDWRTWDEISFALTEVIGEIVTDGTLRRWAKRYGIPEDTGRAGTAKELKAYVTTLGKAGIDLP